MTTWLVVLAVGAGSFVLRAVPLLLGSRWVPTPRAERTMAYAGTAAVAALTVSAMRRGAPAAGEILGIATAAAVALPLAVRGASMVRVLLTGSGAYVAVLGLGALMP
jgi:branched-subunit amino acid transport protein